MGTIWLGLQEGVWLLFGGDPSLWRIIAHSAQVSGAALLISGLLGIPLGAFLGLVRFPGQRLVHALIYTGMGLPPVVVGLAVYLLLSRGGIAGAMGVGWLPSLFTREAMVLAQVVIATPPIVGFTMTAVAGVDPALRQQVRGLGATDLQVVWTVLREARRGVLVSLGAGLGSIISEVGAVMMVGGNIEGSTRVLTTAIVLETRRGNFGLAIGLGLVLLGLAFIINLAATMLQGRGR